MGEVTTDEGHKLWFSGETKECRNGVGLFVHKTIVGSVLHCENISSRIISIRLNASPSKLTVIQVYAATSGHTDEEIEDFYLTLNKTIQNTPRKDVLIVLGDWNAKIGTDAHENWPAVAGKFGLG